MEDLGIGMEWRLVVKWCWGRFRVKVRLSHHRSGKSMHISRWLMGRMEVPTLSRKRLVGVRTTCGSDLIIVMAPFKCPFTMFESLRWTS